jgi:hypothetical protein
MEILIIFLVGCAFRDVYDHVKADYRRSRAARVAEVARQYPGGVIPEAEHGRIARHHALGYIAGEVFHGFPVARTGLHAGWLAHKAARTRAETVREGARARYHAYRQAHDEAFGDAENVFADPEAGLPAGGGAVGAGEAAGIARGRRDPQCIFCGTDLDARPNDGLAHIDCAQAEKTAAPADSWDEPLPADWENPDAPSVVEPRPGEVWDTAFHDGDPEPPDETALSEDDTANPNGDTHMEDTVIGIRPTADGFNTGTEVDGDAGTDLASTKGAASALKGLAGSLTAQIDGIIGNLLSKNADPNVIAHFEQMQEQAAELSGLADQSGALLGGVHTDIADAHAAAGGQEHVADTPWYVEA